MLASALDHSIPSSAPLLLRATVCPVPGEQGSLSRQTPCHEIYLSNLQVKTFSFKE